jgi:hypothetical protein
MRSASRRKFCFRLFIVCVVIGLLSLLNYSGSIQNIKNAAAWPVAEGHISKEEIYYKSKRYVSDCFYDAIFYYNYTVNGRIYNGSENLGCINSGTDARNRMKAFRSKYANAPLSVRYDPMDHAYSIVDLQRAVSSPTAFAPKWPVYLMFLAFGLSAASIITYIYVDKLGKTTDKIEDSC